MGQIMAQELDAANHPFVIVDSSEDRVREAEEHGYLALTGNATEEDTLHLAHIERATSLATVLPNDAANVFITLSARSLNPSLRILARGELRSTEDKLLKAGADRVVLPAAIGGLRLAHMIVRPAAEHLIDTLENASMINDDLQQLGVRLSEIAVPDGAEFEGITVEQLEIKGEGGYLIVALRRREGEVIRKPSANETVQAGDTVIVIGHGDKAPQFTTAESAAREVVYKGDE
jgi:voltage-gated potassium channel